MLRGLDTLHRASIIHRDLKPENAVVDNAFALRLIDFGLAKPLPGSPAAHTISMTAGLLGTPRYMSPEQFGETGALSYATDLWAFGCILFELLTGETLFAANNMMALGHEIMTKPIQVDRPEVPEKVQPFLRRCLEHEVGKRWSNASEALAEFARVITGVRRRLRHERYRDSWGRVLEKKLLERFAVAHKGQLTNGASAEFIALARQEGVAEIDEQRLGEILPQVFAAQQRVFEAEEKVVRARHQLQQEVTRLRGEELARRARGIAELEKAVPLRQQEVHGTIENLLAEELQTWKEKKRRKKKAARDRKRREEQAAAWERRKLAEQNLSWRLVVGGGELLAGVLGLCLLGLMGWGLYWVVRLVLSAIRGN